MSSTVIQEKKRGFHYAYLIVASCIVLCVVCSLMVNCVGVYLKPVSQYFGISSPQFMLYFTILQLSMTVALPIAGKLMSHIDLRILLSASAILCAIGNLMMSFAPTIFVFYIAGAVLGFGTAPMLFLAVPKLIGAWFVKRVGFFIGLSLAFTGIGGMIFNPIQTLLINLGPEGWRTGYLVMAVIILVAALPFTIFIIRGNPAEKGLKPFGFEQVDGQASNILPTELGVSANKAMRTAGFFAVALFGGLIALNQTIYQFLPAYCLSFTDSVPEIAALSAIIASVCMAGLSIGKVTLGVVNDKSVKGGVTLSIVCGIAGVSLMWLLPSLAPALLIGSFLFGFVYAATTVQTTLLTREVFGSRDYTAIYSRVSVVSSLGGAFAATLWGFVIDLPGGFSLMFGLSLGIMILAFAMAMFALNHSKKYERTTE